MAQQFDPAMLQALLSALRGGGMSGGTAAGAMGSMQNKGPAPLRNGSANNYASAAAGAAGGGGGDWVSGLSKENIDPGFSTAGQQMVNYPGVSNMDPSIIASAISGAGMNQSPMQLQPGKNMGWSPGKGDSDWMKGVPSTGASDFMNKPMIPKAPPVRQSPGLYKGADGKMIKSKTQPR